MKPDFSRYSTVFSVVFHGLSIVAWWGLGQLPVNETIMMLLLQFLCIWTLLAIITLLWLLWANRKKLESLLVWGVFQVLFFFFLFGTQLPISIVSFLCGIYLIVFVPVLLVLDIVYAYHHRVALRFIAFGSLAMIWSIVIGGRIQGDLLMIFLDSIGKMNNPLLWLNGIMISTTIIMLAGSAVFIVDSLSILLKELRSPSSR